MVRTVPSAPLSKLLSESCSKKLGFLFHLILEKITNDLRFATQFHHAEETILSPRAYFYVLGKVSTMHRPGCIFEV